MLAIWRTHGLDRALRTAWERGVVLAGLSAGAICWFEGGTTDSFGRALQPLLGGLGLQPGSLCPHFDEEPQRRPAYHALVREGRLPPGWAVDDGAALHFVGTELQEAVSSRPGARAFRVELQDGEPIETAVPTRYLGREEIRTTPPFPGD
jgi:peptidase E